MLSPTCHSADDYIDYDSDYETKSGPAKDVDPYAGALILVLVHNPILTHTRYLLLQGPARGGR